jgi:hypothetical protein
MSKSFDDWFAKQTLANELSGRSLDYFRRDCEAYWRTARIREELADELNYGSEGRRMSPWAYGVKLVLDRPGPEQWRRCTDCDDYGRDPTGAWCRSCKGSHYRTR